MPSLKSFALLATLLLAGIVIPSPAHAAHDMSPEGLEWKRVSEDNLFLNAVAYSKGSQSYPIALLVLVNSSTFTTGLGSSTLSSDYLVRQVNFDCTTRGRYKIWKSWAYRVGSDQPVKIHPLTEKWEVASSFQGPFSEWKVICGEEAGESLPKRNSFDQITADYRARHAQKKAQEERAEKDRRRQAEEREAKESAEFAKRQMSPEIALDRAYGEGNYHWHYAFASTSHFGTVDVHGIEDGATANLKRMSTALFVAEPQSSSSTYPDYIVKFEEFDCSTPGRSRALAGASYQEGGKLLVAFQDPTSKWVTYSADNPMSRFWEWACKGDQKVKALPSNLSFDQTLKYYRDQVK